MEKGYLIKKTDGIFSLYEAKGFKYDKRNGFVKDESQTKDRKFMTFDELRDELDLCSCSFVDETQSLPPEEEERLKKIFFEMTQAWRDDRKK